MRWKRMWAMFKARNYEFFRDKAAFGWNFLFPFLIIALIVLKNRENMVSFFAQAGLVTLILNLALIPLFIRVLAMPFTMLTPIIFVLLYGMLI